MKRILSLALMSIIVVSVLASCDSKDKSPFISNENTEIYYETTPQDNIQVNENGTKYSNNEVLVVANEGISKSKIEQLAKKYNAEIVGYIEITGDYQWKLQKNYTYEELQNLINSIKTEEYIFDATLQKIFELQSETFETPNDQRWIGEWQALSPEGENWGIEAIYAPYAWNYTNAMTPIRVGLIDDTYNISHEDLLFEETYYNVDQSNISSDHGTHVAGTMAAGYNNSIGITGIYPFGIGGDGSSNLYGVSFDGTEDCSSMFYWKVAFANLIVKNVKVINLSVGYADELYMFLAAKGYTEVQEEIKADAKVIGDFLEKLLNKGYDFIITQAAGNSRNARFKKNGNSSTYPYGWQIVSAKGETDVYGLADWGFMVNAIENKTVKDRIIVVGASELKNGFFTKKKTYELASFSSTGNRVDVMAPGVNITSCSFENEYCLKSGTSMAAPHVAGAAATLWSFDTALTGKRVKEIIVSSATTDVKDTKIGMINLLAALADASDERAEGNPFATQKGIITAYVYSEENVQSDAKVEIYDSKNDKLVDTQSTDLTGSFEAVLSSGTYYLLVTKNGFDTTKVEDIVINNGEVLQLDDIRLNPIVTDFTIPQQLVVTLGEIDVIEPKTKPENAAGYSIKWSSSDETVATVSPTGEAGIITSIKKGTTTITAELTSGEKTITKTTLLRVTSKARDTVLVLDVSGSMSGEPMAEMKQSAIKFCNDLLKDEYNNRVGIVFYDNDIYTIDLTDDLNQLINRIEAIGPGGTTNMEGGLAAANRMLQNQSKPDTIKNVVVMADGLPNQGKTSYSGSMPSGSYSGYYTAVSYANAVIDTAKAMMANYNIYSLGFFHDLSGEELEFGIKLMQRLTDQTDGYYQVDRAEDLQFAFGDISEDINVGSKIVINIACPVDVRVTYGDETLSSANSNFCGSTSFGTLQLLGKDKDIKVVSVDSDKEYKVELTGTGEGKMDYSVNYFDKSEQLTDYRSFESVPITPTTLITSDTDNSAEDIALNIDEDGDGEVDTIWTAEEKSEGEITYQKNPPEPEPEPEPETPSQESSKPEKKMPVWVIVLICVGAVALAGGGAAVIVVLTVMNRSSDGKTGETIIPVADPITCPKCGKAHPHDQPCDCEKEEPITERTALRTGFIQVTSGSMNGFTVPIGDGETICLGKDGKFAHLVFSSDYRTVSRMHCTITYDGKAGRYYVVDTSSNGTYLIGHKRLEKGKRTLIRANTVLLLANEDCTVLLG